MYRNGSSTGPGSEFDAFLFALIGEDSTGLPLSVVSALARMDLDPWQEAGELANLSVDAATQRLAGLFSTVPDHSLGSSDRTTVAARLIALLPRNPGGQRTANSMRSARLVEMTPAQPRTYALLVALSVFLLLLLSQRDALRRQPSPTDDAGTDDISATGSSQVPYVR